MPIPVPTIGDFTDAYADTVSILQTQANDEKFTDKLQQLIKMHFSQIELLGGQQPTDTSGLDLAALLQNHQQHVEGICPTAFRSRNQNPLDRAMFALVKTQIFQISIFGGFTIPANWPTPPQNRVMAQEYEENNGLKRCPDGSLVPHGAGCP